MEIGYTSNAHTHTHTHTHIYIYIYICMLTLDQCLFFSHPSWTKWLMIAVTHEYDMFISLAAVKTPSARNDTEESRRHRSQTETATIRGYSQWNYCCRRTWTVYQSFVDISDIVFHRNDVKRRTNQ